MWGQVEGQEVKVWKRKGGRSSETVQIGGEVEAEWGSEGRSVQGKWTEHTGAYMEEILSIN